MTKEQMDALLDISKLPYATGVEGTMEMIDCPREIVEMALGIFQDFKEIIEYRNLLNP